MKYKFKCMNPTRDTIGLAALNAVLSRARLSCPERQDSGMATLPVSHHQSAINVEGFGYAIERTRRGFKLVCHASRIVAPIRDPLPTPHWPSWAAAASHRVAAAQRPPDHGAADGVMAILPRLVLSFSFLR